MIDLKKEEYVPRISSEFREALDVVIKEAKEHKINSSTLIKEAYRVATEIDRYTPKEAYALLKRELAEYYSPQWIRHNIAAIAKEMSHARGKSGKGHAQTILEQSIGDYDDSNESRMLAKIQELEDEIKTLRAGLQVMTKRATDLDDVLQKSSFVNANDIGAPGQIRILLEAEFLELLLALLREAHHDVHYESEFESITYLENKFARLLEASRKLRKKMLPST